MGLFGSKKRSKEVAEREPSQSSPWQPKVELTSAGDALSAAIHAFHSAGTLTNDEIERKLFDLCRLADTPTDWSRMLEPNAPKVGEVMARPWIWNRAVARQAADEERHEIVAASAFWAFTWTNKVQPSMGTYEQRNWLVGDVPDDARHQLRVLAADSLAALPPDQVLFGNVSGEITVGWFAEHLEEMLPPTN